MKHHFGNIMKNPVSRSIAVSLVFGMPATLMFVGMVGCAAHAPDATSPDSAAYARKIIVEKVDTAVRSLQELAAVSQEGKEMVLRKQAALDKDEVDIDYNGKAQPLLESIANRYGYKYLEIGKRSDLKMINVRVERARVLDVLRTVGLQIDQGADVVLDRDAKVVRLIYKKS